MTVKTENGEEVRRIAYVVQNPHMDFAIGHAVGYPQPELAENEEAFYTFDGQCHVVKVGD